MPLKIWTKIRLSKIRDDAKNSLYRDFNGRIKNKSTVRVYLYGIPIFTTLILLILGVFIEKDIASYLITGISIFAGLFFGLLFIVNEKYNSRKDNLSNNRNEETINYLKRYKIFASQLMSQISYTIVLSIGIILLSSIVYFSGNININESIVEFISPKMINIATVSLNLLKYFLNGAIFYLSIQLVLFIIVILSSTYVMLLDDLDFNKN